MSSGRARVLSPLLIVSLLGCAGRAERGEPTERALSLPLPAARETLAIPPRAFPAAVERAGAPPLARVLPGRADQALVLGDGALAIVPEGLASIEGVRDEGGRVFRDAAPDLDVVLVEGRSFVEELRVLRSSRAPTTARYAIHRGAGVARLRVDAARGVVEAVDRGGFVRFATAPMVAVDAQGDRRALAAELTGDTLTVSLDARGLRAPIVVDPQWTATGSMKLGHDLHGAALLPDGRVLVAGGRTEDPSFDLDAELFDPKAGTFSAAPPLLAADLGSLVPTIGGRFLLGCGASSQIYDAATAAWTPTDYAQATNRRLDARLRLGDGRVLSVGGDDGDNGALSGAEIYDPKSNSWSRIASLLHARGGLAASLLGGGKVLVTGGHGVDPDDPSSTGEVWDPATDTWTLTAPMHHAHVSHAAVTLPDGRVLVMGGDVNVGDVGVDAYDPATGTWGDVPPMTFPRARMPALVLGGRVLVIGGRSFETATPTAEWFDPSTSTWSPASSLGTPREDHAAVVLADGRVLVVGGNSTDTGPPISTAEIFDPQLLATGAACTAGSGCASGVCAQAICCAAPCLGACQSCAVPGHLGACTLDPACGALDAGPADAAVDGAIGPTITGDFTSCARGSDCASGHCVDGVCCDTPCTDRCHSCALPGSPGICTPEPVGVDLRRECGGGLQCSGTCGPAGACIGSGAGVQCAPSRCVSSSSGVGPASCTAAGAACPTDLSTPFDCGAYACEPALGACRQSCGSTDDCANGYTCDVAAKACVTAAAPTASGGCVAAGASRGRAPLALVGLGVAIALFARRRGARGSRRVERPTARRAAASPAPPRA